MKAWLLAFRLRTLPLSLSCILIGSTLAWDSSEDFCIYRFVLLVVTTVLLQILSNLANDYGDSENGADNLERIGPDRAVQSGLISKSSMYRAMILLAILSFLSGLGLIYLVFGFAYWKQLLFFLVLGVLAIWSAIKYTAGRNPYGYSGFGDLFVFMFFGIVGVLGTNYLMSQNFFLEHTLPAISIGLFSVAVLNLNNMRDFNGDKSAGKKTMVVRMGIKNARIYHTALLFVAFISSIIYVALLQKAYLAYLFLMICPMLIFNLKAVWSVVHLKDLDGQLKLMALTSFAYSVLFSIGLIFSNYGL
tara:strand:- start:6647 stop:7558 length:912 start_codon:yes stop_codon:yes gene_type:complete